MCMQSTAESEIVDEMEMAAPVDGFTAIIDEALQSKFVPVLVVSISNNISCLDTQLSLPQAFTAIAVSFKEAKCPCLSLCSEYMLIK